MQMYAYNNGAAAAMTDSTLSPSSTPYPGMGPSYNPFGAFLNQTRAFARARAEAAASSGVGVGGLYGGGGLGGGDGGRGVTSAASFRSSPSHLPVPLPPLDAYAGRGRLPGTRKRDRFAQQGNNNGNRSSGLAKNARSHVGVGVGVNVNGRVKPPPRVDSTQPRETSPETSSSSGEETAGEKYNVDVNITSVPVPGRETTTTGTTSIAESQEWTNASGHAPDADEDNGEWIEEESGDELDDLLDLEFHPRFVSNPERRRKKWEQRWDELVNAVSPRSLSPSFWFVISFTDLKSFSLLK